MNGHLTYFNNFCYKSTTVGQMHPSKERKENQLSICIFLEVYEWNLIEDEYRLYCTGDEYHIV